MALQSEQKETIITQFRTHAEDTGSPEVQIALLTERINGLTDHLRTHKHDFHSHARSSQARGTAAPTLAYWRARTSSGTARRSLGSGFASSVVPAAPDPQHVSPDGPSVTHGPGQTLWAISSHCLWPDWKERRHRQQSPRKEHVRMGYWSLPSAAVADSSSSYAATSLHGKHRPNRTIPAHRAKGTHDG